MERVYYYCDEKHPETVTIVTPEEDGFCISRELMQQHSGLFRDMAELTDGSSSRIPVPCSTEGVRTVLCAVAQRKHLPPVPVDFETTRFQEDVEPQDVLNVVIQTIKLAIGALSFFQLDDDIRSRVEDDLIKSDRLVLAFDWCTCSRNDWDTLDLQNATSKAFELLRLLSREHMYQAACVLATTMRRYVPPTGRTMEAMKLAGPLFPHMKHEWQVRETLEASLRLDIEDLRHMRLVPWVAKVSMVQGDSRLEYLVEPHVSRWSDDLVKVKRDGSRLSIMYGEERVYLCGTIEFGNMWESNLCNEDIIWDRHVQMQFLCIGFYFTGYALYSIL